MQNTEYPYEGVISAEILEKAFWQAMLRCDDDPRVHAMDMPCFSRTPNDTLIDGYLPDELWGHMAAVVNEAD